MSILPGRRLGPYEIVSAIGAGGMGEVYTARDTRLDRIVAIKVLPDHLADRATLRERFDREAKTIASLNHPHICTLYDTGHQDDVDFLVMEYIEGETLAQCLLKGPLQIQQMLQYAIEISDALDKAHRKGITHRDLKPGNIMLTKSGTKLLDFGLAKLTQEKPATPYSELPTQKEGITAEGTILGTLQYMAPEQVEGKEADARTDIFAFGVVVYEMATGKKAFEGKSQASLMAKILETDPPPISSLQPMTPPTLNRVVKKCLAKEREDRWQSSGDICEQLRWISDSSTQLGVSLPAAAQRSKQIPAWAWATFFVLVAALVSIVFYLRTSPAEVKVVRFTVVPPEKQSFPVPTRNASSYLSVSPDGSKLAFVAVDSTGRSMLWVRNVDSQTAQLLPGTDNASVPFWSPDSRFIAFTTGNSLKKIAITGGPALTITGLDADAGGTWNRDGDILFGPTTAPPIFRVSSAGGSATPFSSIDRSRQETGHGWPYFLPDGRHFLYEAFRTNSKNTGIYLGSLDSKETKPLVLNASYFPLYSPPGYLLFVQAGTLLAQPFDANRLELKGDAIPIAEGVEFNTVTGVAAVAVSQNGVLAYCLVAPSGPPKLVWVDRKGIEQAVPAPPHNYVFPRVSPDGKGVAVAIEEGDSQIWLYDLRRDTLTRLTFEGNGNTAPIWTPDGKRIVFKGNKQRLFWQPADGSGPAEELTKSELPSNNVPGSFSPDGQVLAFMGQDTSLDLYTLPLKDEKPQPFVNSPANETAPRFSPDGHFIAYQSDESGRIEIYVRSYPGPGGKYQISTEGGMEPVWNPKGRELFYRSGNKMMAVDISAQPGFEAGKPKVLFEGPYLPTPLTFPNYDVSPDGQRFLMLKPEQAQAPTQISVVMNWFEELKQKVPIEKK
jgi:serine/threonine protein kinase